MTELGVIPRSELTRARDWATKKLRDGVVLTVAGFGTSAVVLLEAIRFAGSFPILVGASGLGGYGVICMIRALWSRRAIDAKLRAQQLPPARIVS